MAKTSEDIACFTLRLPRKLHKRFRLYCFKNETMMTNEIRKFIEEKVKK